MKVGSRAVAIVLTLALTLSITGATVGATPPSTVYVSNSNDSGPGSFRAAILQANLNPAIARVVFRRWVSTILLQSTIWFTGPQNLTIDGNRATLDGTNAGGPAFFMDHGDDLTVSDLTVRNAPAEGIKVEVPGGATGTIRVLLLNVDIIDNDGHGVLVNDQVDPTDAANASGSAASVAVSVFGTRFIRNGYTALMSDLDGLRVNEGGEGDLSITIMHSSAEDNGADGIETDERGAGDVRVDMFNSHVTGNGPHDPADLDDGFDIDEAGDGSIVGKIVHSSANNNYEEGFDFNENDAGDLRVDMVLVEANGNREEGIDYEEDDDFAGGGDLVTTMFGVRANGNGVDGGDAGLKIREKGAGNLDVTLKGVETSNNLIGGTSIREDADGNLVASMTKATSLANTGHGIDFDENTTGTDVTGDLTATVTTSNSSNNGGAGVRADEQSTGVGSLILTTVTLNANVGGATAGNVTPTIIP
jgi:hypothetical protein